MWSADVLNHRSEEGKERSRGSRHSAANVDHDHDLGLFIMKLLCVPPVAGASFGH